MKRFDFKPDDMPVFLSSGEVYELGLDHSTSNGITTFDDKANPALQGRRYFVRVGGGWQGFRKLTNARDYFNQP